MALYMCQVLHVVGFFGSRRMETAPRPLRFFYVQLKVSQTSQAVTHLIMNRARRCLTSVIEHKPLSERRIPYEYKYEYKTKSYGSHKDNPWQNSHQKIQNGCQSAIFFYFFFSLSRKSCMIADLWISDLINFREQTILK